MEGEGLVRDEYTRMAHVYEERVVPRFEPIAARTVALAELRPRERVLDVGCGTGLASLLAAAKVGSQGEVVGVDFSEGQLGIAVAKAELRRATSVRFERRDATKLEFEGSFDAVVSNLGIPADFAPTFEGIRAALRPGGRLSITEWEQGKSEPFEAFKALLGPKLVADAPADVVAGREVLRTRRAQFDRIGTVAGVAEALRAAGFADVKVAPATYEVAFASGRDAYDFLLSWGWQEREVRLLPAPRREELQKEMGARFGAKPWAATWHLLHATARKRD